MSNFSQSLWLFSGNEKIYIAILRDGSLLIYSIFVVASMGRTVNKMARLPKQPGTNKVN